MDSDYITVGLPIPRLGSVAPVDGRRVNVTWADGASDVIDLAPAIASHRAFVKLRTDDELFRAVRISEFGDCLQWPNGAELPAAWVEELSDRSLNNAQFREAMDHLHMSLDGMAARLGIARRLIADYRKDKPIPKHIALATRYLLDQRKAG